MKISLEWLADHLLGPLDADAVADALTGGGFPVEGIDRLPGGDAVLDVEVTSNRGDCLSHVGVARELAALLDRRFKDVKPAEIQPATPNAATSVTIEAGDLCPHYTARVIRGVKVAPSPDWLARRLEAVGLRPINNVVDVTNYVMFELGQPLHAFDFDKLAGQRIVVRRARASEKLVSLDGKERTLSPDMLAIADAQRPVALAGVMGGLESEVSAATVNVLLESARFDPLSIRQTARALQMRSDSSYRFERGIDPLLPERASRRAAELILAAAGGTLAGDVAEAGSPGYTPKVLTLRLARLARVLGIDIPADTVVDALARLRLSPALRGEAVEVTVPSDRLDLNIEVDLVEEVARIVGYEAVPVRDQIAIRVTPREPAGVVTETLRSSLVAGGYFEAVTFGFVADLLAGDFVPPEADPASPLPRVAATVRRADASLRPSILPGLLQAVRHNEAAGTDGARLFEIGSTFYNDSAGDVIERQQLGLVGGVDVRAVRGAIEALLQKLDAGRRVEIIPQDRPGFAPGEAGRINWGGYAVGHLGLIDRGVATKLSLRQRPAAAELEVAPLLAGAQLVPQLRPLPKFPAVRRDLSFVLSESVRFEALESLVRRLDPQWLEGLEYVTTYRGKPLEKGTKSVTITLVFRTPEQTLTGEQVQASVDRVTAAARAELNATLRT